MKQQQNLQQLKRVKKVDAPPFLLTRIQAAIDAKQTEQLPVQWKWAGAMALFMIVFFNVMTVKNNLPKTFADDMETLSEGMQISNINQLYHE